MHDARGRPLVVGTRVLIAAVVTQLQGGEDYCNVSVETVHGRRPDGMKEHFHAINTGVLLRADEGDDNSAPFELAAPIAAATVAAGATAAGTSSGSEEEPDEDHDQDDDPDDEDDENL